MKNINTIEKVDADISVPGSKSYTQRAMIIAAMAEGVSHLRGCLDSEDTRLVAEALRALGVDVGTFGDDTIVRGTGGLFQAPREALHLGNNGTGMRFLAAVTSIGKGPVIIDGDPRLRERPVKVLIDAVNAAGGNCKTAAGDGYPPVINYGGGLRGGTVRFSNSESSQYISAILITAPYALEDVTVELEGRVLSRPYITMTLDVMRHFGVPLEEEEGRNFLVRARRKYQPRDYVVEGDGSSASYFFIAAAICGGRIRVTNLNSQCSQGDLGLLNILDELGCVIRREDDGIEVQGGPLAGGDRRYDLSSMPDMVPGLAVLSAFRPGKTTIHNVPHLRIKESDRLAAMVAELNRIGIKAHETDDGIVIEGGQPRGAIIETYNDHRIAMSFAVAGLRTGNMTITGESCVAKSFPTFWTVLEGMAG